METLGFSMVAAMLALYVVFDGFDLGATASAGPGLIREWGLKGPELGVLLSETSLDLVLAQLDTRARLVVMSQL